MDALKTFGNDSANSQQASALGGPIAGRARTIFLTGKNHQWGIFLFIGLGGFKNRNLFTLWEKFGGATFFAGEFIANTDIGEGAPHHHFMIAATRSVGIEILGV